MTHLVAIILGESVTVLMKTLYKIIGKLANNSATQIIAPQ